MQSLAQAPRASCSCRTASCICFSVRPSSFTQIKLIGMKLTRLFRTFRRCKHNYLRYWNPSWYPTALFQLSSSTKQFWLILSLSRTPKPPPPTLLWAVNSLYMRFNVCSNKLSSWDHAIKCLIKLKLSTMDALSTLLYETHTFTELNANFFE